MIHTIRGKIAPVRRDLSRSCRGHSQEAVTVAFRSKVSGRFILLVKPRHSAAGLGQPLERTRAKA